MTCSHHRPVTGCSSGLWDKKHGFGKHFMFGKAYSDIYSYWFPQRYTFFEHFSIKGLFTQIQKGFVARHNLFVDTYLNIKSKKKENLRHSSGKKVKKVFSGRLFSCWFQTHAATQTAVSTENFELFCFWSSVFSIVTFTVSFLLSDNVQIFLECLIYIFWPTPELKLIKRTISHLQPFSTHSVNFVIPKCSSIIWWDNSI